MVPKERILLALNEHVTERLRGQVDHNVLQMIEDLVNKSTEIVLYNIIKTHPENEIDIALSRVSGNVENFISLVVLQLIDFGSGRNEGPFINMFDSLLQQQCELS